MYLNFKNFNIMRTTKTTLGITPSRETISLASQTKKANQKFKGKTKILKRKVFLRKK